MIELLCFFLLIVVLLWIGFVAGSRSKSHEPLESPGSLPDDFESLQEKVSSVLSIEGHHFENDVLSFEGRLLSKPEVALRQINELFSGGDLTPMFLESRAHRARISLLPIPLDQPEEAPPRWWLHALLLLITLVTTTWIGAWHAGGNPIETPSAILQGLPYSLGLLLILGAHELGHYFMARKHGVKVTPPFFIPVPFGLGTFGAFIKMKSLSPSRRVSFDIAVAGPLAGLVFAIPALLIGLSYSKLVIGDSNISGWMHGGGVEVGSSLLMALSSKLILGSTLSEGHQILLHPLAFAGWLGLLVTALNLLPIGQLDGGHMTHALFGSTKAHGIGVASLVVLFLMAIFVWPGLMMWAIIVYFIAGTRDVPPMNDITPVGKPRKILGFLTFALLLSILLPLPHWLYQSFGLYCPYI